MNSSLLHPSQRSSSPAEVIFRKLLKPLVDSHFSAPVSCLTCCLSSCAVPSSKQSTPLALPIPLSKACLRRTTCTPRLAYSLFSTSRSSPLCHSPFKNTAALSRSMDSLSVVDEHAMKHRSLWTQAPPSLCSAVRFCAYWRGRSIRYQTLKLRMYGSLLPFLSYSLKHITQIFFASGSEDFT